MKVWSYLQPQVTQGVGIVGQPVQPYYFHRPLSVLLRPFFDAGFALDGLEEPAFPVQTELRGSLRGATFRRFHRSWSCAA